MEAIEKYFVDAIATQKQYLLLSMLTRSQHPMAHSGVLEKDRDAGRKLKEEKVAGAKEAGQRVCMCTFTYYWHGACIGYTFTFYWGIR